MAEVYEGGEIRKYSSNWLKLTKDKFVINIVKRGLEIKFADSPVLSAPHSYPKNREEVKAIDTEIQSLLRKNVIQGSSAYPGDHFSDLFTRSKSDGSLRVILNLKKLNKFAATEHFKMDTLQNVVNMIRPNAYFASIDLKDAFYSVPIHVHSQKYLKFVWKGNVFKFVCMPNGFNDAMRTFTKLMKVPFLKLRDMGHFSIIYVDDSLLMGLTYSECVKNVIDTVKLLISLGFTIHFVKSLFEPKQLFTFLGFDFDSVKMVIAVSEKKQQKILKFAHEILHTQGITIRKLSSFIGYIVSAIPAVPYGKLHYRVLESFKIDQLTFHKGNFDVEIRLTEEARLEVTWWIENIPRAKQTLLQPPLVDQIIYSDASTMGWGAWDGRTSTNGRWLSHEKDLHINALEMKAMMFAIKSFCKDDRKHIRIMCDNTTAITYINKMGGTKAAVCNRITQDIWEFCKQHDYWISAAFIPGRENIKADQASRIFNTQAEWMIPDSIFHKLCNKFGSPEVDLFASRENCKLTKYVSWRPDPDALAVDCFSLAWQGLVYCFPPFSMVWRTLRKIQEDETTAILVVPFWRAQSWFPTFKRMICQGPMHIKGSSLLLPGSQEKHPMRKNLTLLAAKVCAQS